MPGPARVIPVSNRRSATGAGPRLEPAPEFSHSAAAIPPPPRSPGARCPDPLRGESVIPAPILRRQRCAGCDRRRHRPERRRDRRGRFRLGRGAGVRDPRLACEKSPPDEGGHAPSWPRNSGRSTRTGRRMRTVATRQLSGARCTRWRIGGRIFCLCSRSASCRPSAGSRARRSRLAPRLLYSVGERARMLRPLMPGEPEPPAPEDLETLFAAGEHGLVAQAVWALSCLDGLENRYAVSSWLEEPVIDALVGDAVGPGASGLAPRARRSGGTAGRRISRSSP